MLRKVIFSVLALLVAWGLGNVLYETWMQGHVYYTSSSTYITYDNSYSSDRLGFYGAFFFQVFMVLCAVVPLLGLGWMKKNSGSIWKSSSRGSIGTDVRTTADIPLKVRLRWVGIGALASLAFAAYQISTFYLHNVPIPAVLWGIFLGSSVAAAIIYRTLMRQSPPLDGS
jgi:hypothetical protein